MPIASSDLIYEIVLFDTVTNAWLRRRAGITLIRRSTRRYLRRIFYETFMLADRCRPVHGLYLSIFEADRERTPATDGHSYQMIRRRESIQLILRFWLHEISTL